MRSRSLQSQLSRIQGSRGASAFTLGSLPEDPWVTTIPTSLAPEPLKHDRQQQTAFAPSALAVGLRGQRAAPRFFRMSQTGRPPSPG